MKALDGLVVIVTGAGAGLGRAYAVSCAQAGAAVVVNDVDEDAAESAAAEMTSAGGTAVACVGSVSSWEFSRSLVAEAQRHFGGVDGLVANAAVKHESLPWQETEADLRRGVEVNVLGVQFCATHAMRAMIERGGGSVVTVVSGARLGIGRMGAYGATKGAVASMTAGWAIDGAGVGIRANAISPLAETAMAAADRRTDRPFLGPPAAVAPLVVAMLSDATAEVTGQIIRFDGTSLSMYEASTSTHLVAGPEVELHDPLVIANLLTRAMT